MVPLFHRTRRTLATALGAWFHPCAGHLVNAAVGAKGPGAFQGEDEEVPRAACVTDAESALARALDL